MSDAIERLKKLNAMEEPEMEFYDEEVNGLTDEQLDALLPSLKASKGRKPRAKKAPKPPKPKASPKKPRANANKQPPEVPTTSAEAVGMRTRRSLRATATVTGPADILDLLDETATATSTAAASNEVIDISSSPPPSRIPDNTTVPAGTNTATSGANGVIDLSSSPPPRSSEDELMDILNKEYVPDPYEVIDLINDTVTVIILWKHEKRTYHKLRMYQKFKSLFEELAAREKIDISNVCLTYKDAVVEQTHWPASINFNHYDTIEGRAMKLLPMPSFKDPSILTFKVQCAMRRRPFFVQMRKDEKFIVLYGQCAEELSVPPNFVRLRCDDEEMLPEDVPSSLEMTGGEMLDLIIKED